MNGGDLHGMTYHCHCLIEFISEKLGSEVKPFPRMGLLILICYTLMLILLRKYKNQKTLTRITGILHEALHTCNISHSSLLVVYTTTHCSLKAYCAILVRRSNFHHQVSPRESTQRRKVKLWARNVW